MAPPPAKTSDGSEATIFDCTDHLAGGADMSTACHHQIDQGAICYSDARPSQMNANVEECRGCGATAECYDTGAVGAGSLWTQGNNAATGTQAVVFGCVEFYTAQCEYDVSNMGERTVLLSWSAFQSESGEDDDD